MAKFPLHYRPRPYQAELHQMWKQKKIGVGVLPRQTGKDVAMSMDTCEDLLKTGKTTAAYISLDNPMIRDILYDKTYFDPESGEFIQALQDNVPSELVKWNSTLMEGRFTNKSRLKLQGYFQSGKDKNGVGTSFQTYCFTELALFSREDPIPRLMPIINNPSERKRLKVVSTPRGKRRNPLWQLISTHRGNDDFQVILRTIDDINTIMRRSGLPPVLSQAQLESIREDYKKRFGNDRMFEQEYHCSFEEMDAAAVYGEAYMKMVADGRVQIFNLQQGHPVYVAFDIGSAGMHSDATSWIAFQWVNGRLFIYDCGEGHGKALPDYVDDLQAKHWFNKLACIILPWDSEHHEKSINETPADMMRQRFPNVAVLAKSRQAFKVPGSRQGDYTEITDIQATRMMLYNTIIHATLTEQETTESGLWVPAGTLEAGNCQWVLECIENYKYEFNYKLQEWSDRPLHDKFSHMMDALRYVVQATKELDFFNGSLYEESGRSTASVAYTDDWEGVWRR